MNSSILPLLAVRLGLWASIVTNSDVVWLHHQWLTQGRWVTAPACVHLGTGWTEKQDDSQIDEANKNYLRNTDHFKANTDYFNWITHLESWHVPYICIYRVILSYTEYNPLHIMLVYNSIWLLVESYIPSYTEYNSVYTFGQSIYRVILSITRYIPGWV